MRPPRTDLQFSLLDWRDVLFLQGSLPILLLPKVDCLFFGFNSFLMVLFPLCHLRFVVFLVRSQSGIQYALGCSWVESCGFVLKRLDLPDFPVLKYDV